MLPLALLAGGAALGGLAKGLLSGGGLTGHREKYKQLPLYNKPQISGMNSLLQQGLQNTNFAPIEQQELTRFNQQTIPGLAERFTAMGDSGQRSSGFQQALGGAAGDLGARLAALRSQFGMQQLGMGMRPQFENIFTPRQAGGLEQGLGAAMPFLGAMGAQSMFPGASGSMGAAGGSTDLMGLLQMLNTMNFQSPQAYR